MKLAPLTEEDYERAANLHHAGDAPKAFMGAGGELWTFVHAVRNALNASGDAALAARSTEMLAAIELWDVENTDYERGYADGYHEAVEDSLRKI